MTDDIRFWVNVGRNHAAHERRVLKLMKQHLFGYPIREVEMEGAEELIAAIRLGTHEQLVDFDA